MSSISNFFLRTKHWVIFLLSFGLMMAGQFVMIIYIGDPLSSSGEMKLTLVIFLTTILSIVPWFTWLWASASFLSSIQQAYLGMDLGFFKFAIVFPIPYLFLFFYVFQSNHPAAFLFIFPIHLFAMYCIFYTMYFVAKNLSQVEIGRRANFSDYAGYFFLLWFYPIGIWFIQPKINRLYAAKLAQA